MNNFVGRRLLKLAIRAVIPMPVFISLSAAQNSPGPTTSAAAQEKPQVTQHATGTFDVKMTPQKPDNEISQPANIGRFSGDKVFHGDLEATSKVEMLAAGDPKSSAGYVAMECVTGTLKGHKGSFVLQHSGTINRGVQSLSITVVPDSGADELKGLSGKMKILIAPDGKHSYEFDYTIE